MSYAETWMEAHSEGLALGLTAGDERNSELRAELEEAQRELTAYQIAKDNMELRLEVWTSEEISVRDPLKWQVY